MKNIIITGGSRGIGLELVKKALEENCKVMTIARNTEELQQIQHPHLLVKSCDLQEVDSIKQVFSDLPFDTVDILINNAGLLVKKPFEHQTYEDFLQSFQVNYYAPAHIVQILQNVFAKNAHVVNISTIGAIQGSVKFPELSTYGGTKAALIHLTEMLAEEWKDSSISINCLALGAVQTQMLEEAFPGYQAPINAQQMAQYIFEFAYSQGKYFNGKILQVSTSTP